MIKLLIAKPGRLLISVLIFSEHGKGGLPVLVFKSTFPVNRSLLSDMWYNYIGPKLTTGKYCGDKDNNSVAVVSCVWVCIYYISVCGRVWVCIYYISVCGCAFTIYLCVAAENSFGKVLPRCQWPSQRAQWLKDRTWTRRVCWCRYAVIAALISRDTAWYG